jgi:hypothetical protein
MIFQFFFLISTWATKALEDGKVTAIEGLELIVSLCGLLGVHPEFNISDHFMQLPDNPVEDNIKPTPNISGLTSKDPAFPINTDQGGN